MTFSSIHSWREFKKLFLEKLVDEKTPPMLLNELKKINMGEKHNVKYSNKKSNFIMNNLPPSTQPHDSITIDYYIVSFPTNISLFIKRDVKEAFSLKFTEEIIMEKEFLSIGVITNDDEYNDSKEMDNKS